MPCICLFTLFSCFAFCLGVRRHPGCRSCFACWSMGFLVCSPSCRAHPTQPCVVPSFASFRGLSSFTRFILCLGLCIRIGEARVPGPNSQWKIGHCNPAGLSNKAHMLADSDVDLWLVSETHLSSQSFRQFGHRLRSDAPQYQWCVGGKHVQPRSTTSDHGSWTGVCAIAAHPTRRLPHNWHPRVYDTSRIMACTTYCSGLWLSGVVVYGVPGGPTHPNARLSTNAMLQEGLNRITSMSGPRFIAGDWNHDLDSLPCFDQLQALQFVEVQDLHFRRTGCPPQPTCRGRTRRDFLFISPELIPFFQSTEVDHHQWVDHSSVIATFQGGAADLVRYPWPLPSALPWKHTDPDDLGSAMSFAVGDCTQLYIDFWHSVEQRVVQSSSTKCMTSLSKCVGRGTRLKPLKVQGTPAPIRASRQGEVCPGFFDHSFLHRHWFRQLRRLQSLVRLLGSPSHSVAHTEHRCCLWRAILKSPGFKPCFADWWPSRPVVVHSRAVVGSQVPSLSIATLIFEDLQKQVQDLEVHLNASRRTGTVGRANHGLSDLYRAVKRDAPAQVDVLFRTKQATITELNPDDCAIVVDPPQDWDESLPLVVQGSAIAPIYVTPDCLWLDTLETIEVGQVLTQTKGVGKLDAVFEVFIDYWSKFWCQHSDTPISHWDTILNFARTKLPKVQANPLRLTVPLLRATLRSKKSRSATGLDGVSREDILQLTGNEMQSLVSLYDRAAHTGEWPRQVVQGLVKSLAKKVDPMDAPDYRPICVFSVVYRLWSSLQSCFWLSQVSSGLSSTLSGNRAGHQASTLWRRVLEEVEMAQSSNHAACGIILDLTKAFNTLPRLPCLAMSLILGLDSGTVNAWAGALGLMTRRFWINGSVSRSAYATCGFPEGCGLSCLAMLVLTQAWHTWTTEATRIHTPLSYVDNWEILTSSPDGIIEAFERTMDFARRLELKVDAGKTVCWAAQPKDRASLRNAGFTVVHDCRDLGAHVVFSRQIRNASMTQRFSDLSTFWPRLKHAPGTYQQKCRIIRTVAWPRCLHGISGSIVGKKHFHGLRSALASSLRQSKPGVNSFVLCWLDHLDPQLTAIICTIREWRSLGDLSHKQIMIAMIASREQPSMLGPNTLSQVLLQRLQILGWMVDQNGCVNDGFGKFNILETSWTSLLVRIRFAWQQVVAAQVRHRSDFSGLVNVDLDATQSCISAMGSYEAGIYRHNLAGMTSTNEHACFWSTDGAAQCVHCGQRDSLQHRYWECQFTADLRGHMPQEVIEVVPQLPPALTIRGWWLRSPCHQAWLQMLESIPDNIMPVDCPQEQEGPINLFTDGSCFWPSQDAYRIAGWGVTFAPALTLDPLATDSTVLAAGGLPGITQTAYRAELYAVMVGLTLLERWNRPGRIWLDCQSVLDRFQLYVHGHRKINPASPHHDLWMEICRIVHSCGPDIVQLVKVSAHTTWSGDAPAALRWAIVHNACVDRVARLANQARDESFWSLWRKHSVLVHQVRNVSAVVVQHQLAVCKRWSEGNYKPAIFVLQREPKQGRVFAKVWENVTDLLRMPSNFVTMFGQLFAMKLHEWWQQVVERDPAPLHWVSFSQLYLLFQRQCKHPGVIKSGRHWLDPSVQPACLPERFSFKVRSKWFRLTLQQFWKFAGFKVGTACTRPKSSMFVCHLGSASIPISLERLDLLDDWLRDCLPGPVNCQGEHLNKVPVAWV